MLLRPDQTSLWRQRWFAFSMKTATARTVKKARLKYLVDRWGVEDSFQKPKTARLPSHPFASAEDCEPRGPLHGSAHIGVHPQKQRWPFLYGRIRAGRPHAGGANAGSCRDCRPIRCGKIRLTVWQNLVIPNIAAEHVESATRLHCSPPGSDFKPGRC